MSTKLEQLLEKIDPKNTIDVSEKRINNVIASIQRSSNTVSSFEEYQDCLAEIVQVGRKAVLNLPFFKLDDKDIDFGEAIRFLSKEYPGDTIQIVYSIMLSGAEGGVYQIMKALASVMAEEYTQNQITANVVECWDNLTLKEKDCYTTMINL